MAQINPQTQEWEFDGADLTAAWQNAPVLENKAADEFRLCYICKFHLERKIFAQDNDNGFAWTLDLINAQSPKLQPSNYVAVHQNCVPNRSQMDARKQLKLVKATKWHFDEDYFTN